MDKTFTEHPSVLKESETFWLLDKPSGWLVHPQRGVDAPALTDWVIQNLGQTCNVQFQSITNPVLKSYIPPKEQCDWAKSPPKCANDDDCSKWATTNCKGKNFVENYCKDNGYCHFKI